MISLERIIVFTSLQKDKGEKKRKKIPLSTLGHQLQNLINDGVVMVAICAIRGEQPTLQTIDSGQRVFKISGSESQTKEVYSRCGKNLFMAWERSLVAASC